MYKLQYALQLNTQTKPLQHRIKQALKANELEHNRYEIVLQQALEKEILSPKEHQEILKAYKAKQEIIHVDAFDNKRYKEQK